LSAEGHCVTVSMKPAKTMELLCSSAEEAQQWFEAFKAAVAHRGADEDAGDGLACDDATRCESPIKVGADLAQDDIGGHSPADASTAASDDEAEAALPTARGTFLDLTTEPERQPCTGGSLGRDHAGHVEAAAVVDFGRAKLQAAQFGFDCEEDSGSSVASSPVATPRGGTGSDGSSLVGQCGLNLAGVEGVAPGQADSRPMTHRSFVDQHEGLSMKERLASLELSDAEDEDDNPLGLGTTNAA